MGKNNLIIIIIIILFVFLFFSAAAHPGQGQDGVLALETFLEKNNMYIYIFNIGDSR